MSDLITLGLVSFFAFVLSGTFGFGSGLLLTPLVMLLLPPKTAIAVVTSAYFVSTLLKTFIYWKETDWKTAIFVAVSAAPATYLGSILMVSAPIEILKKLLAGVIFFYVLKEFFKWSWKIEGKFQVAFGSSFYGLLTGLIGTASPIKAMVFNDLKITKEGFVGAMASTALLMNVIKLGNWAHYSLIGKSEIKYCLVLSATAALGAVVGKRFIQRITADLFRKGILAVLLASAAGLLV